MLFLTALELAGPLRPHTLHLLGKLVLFEPQDELPQLLPVQVSHEVLEDQLYDFPLVFDGLEDAVQLLSETFEHACFLGEPLPILLHHPGDFGEVEVQDAHNFQVDGLGWSLWGDALADEAGAVEEVFVDVTDEHLNDLVHVVVGD